MRLIAWIKTGLITRETQPRLRSLLWLNVIIEKRGISLSFLHIEY